MSAIFGIIDLENRPIEPAWIRSMQKDLAHRGPDGKTKYQENSMFLGHMLLRVTPESFYDTSPYEEDGYIITANARLDEREAIMNRLGTSPAERETVTDPLLLLRSYKKFGKGFVKDIYGDFAFAIWDKNKKELFCARDQIGVKPLLYYFEDNRFIFSTELKSIVNLEIVKTKINDANIRNDYFDGTEDLGTSIWKKIFRLPAANHLLISQSSFEMEQYWTLHYLKTNLFKDLDTSAKALQSAIEIAIKDRMRTIHNIGIPLSGGLDSSSIACVAAKLPEIKGRNLYSCSSMLDPNLKNADMDDEAEYIEAVLTNAPNITPRFFYSSQLSFFRNMLSKFERYYAIFSLFNYVDEELYNQFEQVKARRLLSGFIGDITVSNRTILPLVHLLHSGKFLSLGKLAIQLKKRSQLSYFKILKIHLLSPLIPYSIRKIWNSIKGNKENLELDIPIILNDEEKKEFIIRRKEFTKNKSSYSRNIEDHILPKDIEIFREDFDTGSSHYQMEYTYPLMDRRVLECLMKVPVEYYYAHGFKRGLIKKAMKEFLPVKIRERNSKGFYSPGFYNIIHRDIPELIKNIENGVKDYPELSEKFNINEVINHLKIMNKYKTSMIFTSKDWDYLYISSWLIYKFWAVNKANNDEEKLGETTDQNETIHSSNTWQ